MVMRVCTTLAVVAALAHPPLLAQDFEGVARVYWLLIDSAAMRRLGAHTVEEAFAIPHERLAAAASQNAPLRVFVRAPRVRIDVGSGPEMQQLLLDYEKGSYWRVDHQFQRFAKIEAGDGTLGSTMLFLSASTIHTGRVLGRGREAAWIDSLQTEVVEFDAGDLRIRWWLAKRSQDADWRAMTRTLSRLRHDPLQLPAIVPPPMPVRAAFIPGDGRDGFMLVDYQSIARGAVDSSVFAVPGGFREVDSTQMNRPSEPREAPLAPRSHVHLDAQLTAPESGGVFLEAVVDVRPEAEHCPSLEYPPTLRTAGVQGRVVIQFILDTTGHAVPSSLRAIESPHDSLSAVARRMALACTFRPGQVRGRPVRVLVNMPIDFTLTPRRDTTPPRPQ